MNNATAISVENNVQSETEQAVPVFVGTLQDERAQLVDARSLHRFLQVDTHFKDWISRRISEYGFQDGEDFRSFLSKSSGGRPSREYHITLDMAKELSMVERNDNGRQARRYFIACEKRLQQIAPQDVTTIRGQTIGTDGFHCLAAVLDGELRLLKGGAKRAAKNHIWQQVHRAFSVVRAEDIPSEQLDSARNFIASYSVREGEWLPKPEHPQPVALLDYLLPPEQAKEIDDRLVRLGRLFHPFSDPFSDVIGISNALRGRDPKNRGVNPGYRQVLRPI